MWIPHLLQKTAEQAQFRKPQHLLLLHLLLHKLGFSPAINKRDYTYLTTISI